MSTNAPTDKPMPHITSSKNKVNPTSRRRVVLIYSNDKSCNKEVATICGESVGEGGQIPFSVESHEKVRIFAGLEKIRTFHTGPRQPKTLRIIIGSGEGPTMYRGPYGLPLSEEEGPTYDILKPTQVLPHEIYESTYRPARFVPFIVPTNYHWPIQGPTVDYY